MARPLIVDALLPRISSEGSEALSCPFSEEKVQKTIFSLARGKALGPNGFPKVFFQNCSDIIKANFLNAMQEFQEGRAHLRGITRLLILIPKK